MNPSRLIPTPYRTRRTRRLPETVVPMNDLHGGQADDLSRRLRRSSTPATLTARTASPRCCPFEAQYHAAARTRRILSSHARYAAAVTSYVRQNAGHQAGTPGLAMTLPCARSKTPWAASASTTTHSDDLKPDTATARNARPTMDSSASTCVDAPMAANSA